MKGFFEYFLNKWMRIKENFKNIYEFAKLTIFKNFIMHKKLLNLIISISVLIDFTLHAK